MKKLNNRSGFTITELLISVVIIAIGVVGFATAVGVQSMELQIGRRDTNLSLSITRKVEELKSLQYDSLQTGSEVDGDYALSWTVQAGDPKRVVMEAQFESTRGNTLADTVVFYVPR